MEGQLLCNRLLSAFLALDLDPAEAIKVHWNAAPVEATTLLKSKLWIDFPANSSLTSIGNYAIAGRPIASMNFRGCSQGRAQSVAECRNRMSNAQKMIKTRNNKMSLTAKAFGYSAFG